MADNLSIAFEIYDRINRKQQEQIKNKTIKPEEVIDFTEHDFIEDLQKTVNLHTKSIEKANVIDDVYRNILKSVEGISSIDEITTSSGIRIPEKMILESVNNAVNAEKNRNLENETMKGSEILLSALAIKEVMDTYKNLSEEEQKSFRDGIYTQIFGKETADMIAMHEEIYDNLKNSAAYQSSTKEEQQEADKTIESNNPFTSIAEKLGLKPEIIKTPEGQLRFALVIEKLSSLDQGTHDLENILADMGIQNPKEYLEQLKTKLKDDQGFLDEIGVASKKINKNYLLIDRHKDELRKILGEQLSPDILEALSEKDITDCFLMSIGENGDINPLVAQASVKYVLEKERNGVSLAERFGISIDNLDFWQSFKTRIEELNLVIKEETPEHNIGEEVSDGAEPELFADGENFGMDFGDLDMGLSEEYTAISDELMEGYMETYSEDLILSHEMIQMLETGAGMEGYNVDYVEATDLQIPEAEVTPIYVASMDEIQVDPAIYGMSDEEKETPPEVEESEVGEKTSNSEEMQSVDLMAEEIDVKEDEETREEQEKDEDEDKTMPKVFGIDSFNALLNTIELTESENRATYQEILPNDKEIDNGNISK